MAGSAAASGSGSATAIITADTLPAQLLANRDTCGAKPAIIAKRRGIWHPETWRQLADEAAALAAALSACGVGRGQTVALIGDATPHIFAAMAAVQTIGAIAFPLYPTATPDELREPLRTASVSLVFAENQEQVDKLLALLPDLPALTTIVFDEDRGMHHYGSSQLVDYGALVRDGEARIAAAPGFLGRALDQVQAADPAFRFLTPGTTGPSEAIVHTHGAMLARARAAIQRDRLTADDITLALLPMGWICQIEVAYAQALVAGYAVGCPESADTMLGDLRELAPTVLVAPPRVLAEVANVVEARVARAGGLVAGLYRSGMSAGRAAAERRYRGRGPTVGQMLAGAIHRPLVFAPLRDALGISRLRTAYIAGDVAPPSLITFYRALGIDLRQLYGSTATGYGVAAHRRGDVRADSVGMVADGFEVGLAADGELLVRASAGATPDAPWTATGDIGRLDPDGHLRIVDRKANLTTRSGGLTAVPPRQIEVRLQASPYIREALVFADGRGRTCALIDIEAEAVGRWADARAESYTGRAALAALPAVYGLIGEAVTAVNRDLAAMPDLAAGRIHRFVLLRTELTDDDGLLTRIGTPRRAAIATRFATVIDAMLRGDAAVDVAEPTAGHDEPTGALAIRDVVVA